ncbi:MAG: class I SAM-dependent DNA methyltransferase [Phycisphaerae bacterium]
MARSRRKSVQKYHDRVAGRYDDSYDDLFWQWHDALTWDLIRGHLPRDANAHTLDLGCGTGKWGGKLAKSGYDVTGVDISPKMLDKTREKWLPYMGGKDPVLVQADLCSMPTLPDRTYALALAMGDPIGCTASPPTALREIRRVLTDDGILVASFDNRLSAMEFHLDADGPEGLAELLKNGKTHWLTRDQDEQFPIYTYAPTELRRMLEQAGYVVKEMVGRTVLPMRHHRHRLEDPQARRLLTKLEKTLSRDPHAMGRASHIHVVCQPRA